MPQSPPDPTEWIAAARAGSREAWGRGLQTYRRYLLHVARQELAPRLRATGGASDLVQETLLEAYRDLSHFHGHSEAELLSWLRQLLFHHLAKLARKYRTRKRQVGCEVGLDGGDAPGDRGGGLTADLPSPSGEAVRNEEEQALRQALLRLPEDYRQVIVWHHYEKCTFERIGARMRRSPEAARKLWARAVLRLRQEMGAPP